MITRRKKNRFALCWKRCTSNVTKRIYATWKHTTTLLTLLRTDLKVSTRNYLLRKKFRFLKYLKSWLSQAGL